MADANGTANGGSAAEVMEDVLRRLQSPDNAVRGEAEAQFVAAKATPSVCLEVLAVLATASADELVREAAAVLLRRTAKELWGGADERVRLGVKSTLLQSIRGDYRDGLRKKLCDTIGSLGGHLLSENGWPELLPQLLSLSTSTVATERESSLYIFSQITSYLSAADLETQAPTLRATVEVGLADAVPAVRVAALRATCATLNVLESKACRAFEPQLPAMLTVVSSSLAAGDEVEARTCMELLVEVLDAEPRIWRSQLGLAANLMLSVASATALEENTRQLGLEFLVVAAEKLPGACRKLGTFVRSVLPVALGMMLEIEDEPEWHTRDEEEEDSSDYTNFSAGQEALDRLAMALGGKSVLPIAEELLPAYLNSADRWVNRHAALLAISQIGEGCRKQLEGGKLGSVVGLALHSFKDPHPRVRWAAVNCVGQMCTDFGPGIQEQFHALVLPALVGVMADGDGGKDGQSGQGSARVQSHAAAAVINFCDEASPTIMAPYLDTLLGQLMALLQSPRLMTQEQAVTAIAAVADAAETQFDAYYGTFMPPLKAVLTRSAGNQRLRRLRGKVMECISLIGLSVGRERFGADAAEVMDALVRTSADAGVDDPQAFYLMQAYARICRCLRDGFLPYLPYVMPGLLAAASQKPDIEVLGDDAVDDEEEGLETVTLGDKRIGIRTAALEDKATACTMLTCFVTELGVGMLDYVEPVAHLMVPLLQFFYHDEVRTAAANCLPDLLRCVKNSGTPSAGTALTQLVAFMLPTLLEAIANEPETEVLSAMVEALGEIVDVGGVHVTGGADAESVLGAVAGCLERVVTEAETRRGERVAAAEEDGWDEEENEEANEEEAREEELLSHVGDAIGTVVRSGGLPALGSLLEHFYALLATERSGGERRVALCVFDDVVEHGGAAGLAWIPRVLPALCAYAADEDPDVRQAATYGVGAAAEVCALGGAEATAAFMAAGGAKAALSLEAVITAPNSREEGSEMATDNAVCALGKLLEVQAGCIGGDGVASRLAGVWLSYLPLRADVAEARVVHAALVRACERGDERVFGGATYAGLPRVLSVLSEVIGTELLDDEYSSRAVSVIARMQAGLPAGVLEAAMATLSPAARAKLLGSAAGTGGNHADAAGASH